MDVDAFILVGGRSTRFGEDKAAVVLDGETLTDRATDTIHKSLLHAGVTLVAASNEQIPAPLLHSREAAIFVIDLYPDRGAYGGVHAALANARNDWVLILACDLPLITSELIDRLFGFISDDIDAVAPLQPDGEIQSLCAFYRRKPCLSIAEEPLVNKRSTPPVKAIFDKVRTRFVQFKELADLPGSERFFLNMNTPEDLQIAREFLAAKNTRSMN
jgi:molybdenum cofactor guanylyltransferase